MKIHIIDGGYALCGRKSKTGMSIYIGCGLPRRDPRACKVCLKRAKAVAKVAALKGGRR